MLIRPITYDLTRPISGGVTGGLGMAVIVNAADGYRADTALVNLSISTPDGGNELVHPSIWDTVQNGMASWNGKRYWMAATPYAGSDIELENPCIYAADSIDGPWVAPVGLANPIDPAPGSPAHNSDTHLVFPGDGYLYCFYRFFNPSAVGAEENIVYRRSLDGVVWEAEVVSLVNNLAIRRLVSPAIEWDGSQWVMYAVDIVPSPNNVVRLTSPTLVGATWSVPAIVPISPAFPAGRECWHLDAKCRNGVWWLLIQDTPIDGSSGGSIYLCKSDDGSTLTRPDIPVMTRGGNWHELVYRSCLVSKIVAGKLAFDMMYTGIGPGTTYHLGHTEVLPFDTAAYAAEPAAAIAGAAASTPPYLIGDDFTRANGVLGTSTGGEVWTISAGVPNVLSNMAGATTAANTRAFLESGASDIYAEVQTSGHPLAGTDQTWLVVRLSDGNNFVRVGYRGTGLVAEKIVAGAATVLRSVVGMAPGNAGMPNTVRLSVRANGSNYDLILDGRRCCTFSDAFNTTATKHGFQTQNLSSRFDNLWARSLTGGV